MNNNLKPVTTLPPFRRLCMTIGELPTSYLETMTYYEMLVWFTEYMKNTVIPAINNNGEAVSELQSLYVELKSYIDNYFDNLDVQQEINNKLDEMVEAGTLQEIITDYLNSKAIFAFDNVASMKISTNLIDGSYAETLGYYTKNDGGKALYKIREITNDDTIDEKFIIALTNSNTLIAELIVKDVINIKCIGAVSDGETDIVPVLTSAISKFNTIYIPSGSYKMNTTITLTKNTYIYGDGTIQTWSGRNPTTIINTPDETYAFKCEWNNSNKFENLTFNGYGIDEPCGTQIIGCEFKGHVGIRNGRVVNITQCSFHGCDTAGIYKITDSKVVNNYIYENTTGIDLTQSNDNLITNNKIEWNNLGININTSVYNIINNNIFDRNTTYGIEGTDISVLQIQNNQFERNLTAHVKLNGGTITLTNNEMLCKNSEDDGSGTVLPNNAIVVPSIQNSSIKNNVITVPETGKMFKEYPTYQSNVVIESNTLNGKNTSYFGKTLGSITVAANSTQRFTFAWSNLDHLGLNGYDVSPMTWYIEIDGSKNRYLQSTDYRVSYHQNNGFFVDINNVNNSETKYNIWVYFRIISPYKVTVPSSS